MAEITNELIYEVLKKVQADIVDVRKTQADHGEQFISMRDQMNNGFRNLQTQIYDLQGEFLRLEKSLAAVTRDVDLIKRRLDLVDAE